MRPRSLFQDPRGAPWKRWLPSTLQLMVGAGLLFLLAQLYYGLNMRGRVAQEGDREATGVLLPSSAQQLAVRGPTLVIYVFSGSDPEYANNLRFFLREAVQADDGCDYVLVLQEGEGLASPEPLPELPPNVRLLRHENRCYDLGTVGWVLSTQVEPDTLRRYDYIIWLNSSVRGPFLPAYLCGKLHWTEPLLSKLSASVKLVGPTINCGRAYELPPTPHLQSYVAATDATGLQVLLKTKSVFACWDRMRDVVIQGEIGASAAILDAGYNIDSLMLRYQGLDWREPHLRVAHCNAALNPLQPGFNDGVTVDPLEVMFIKVKGSMMAAGNWPHASAAVKMDSWLAAQSSSSNLAERLASTNANEWPHTQAPALLADAQRRGPDCFDTDFYIRSSMYDLGGYLDLPDGKQQAWDQFLRMGLYEGRPYRFTC